MERLEAARVLKQLHGGQWRNSSRRIRENNAVKTFNASFALKSVFCSHGSMDLTSVGVCILRDFLRCETVICMNFLLHELPKPKLMQNVIFVDATNNRCTTDDIRKSSWGNKSTHLQYVRNLVWSCSLRRLLDCVEQTHYLLKLAC